MEFKELLGYAATIVSVSTLFPQINKIIKTKSTKDISTEMTIIGSLGSSLWFVYGYLSRSTPIMIANFIVVINFLIILSFKLKYK